MAKDPHDHRTMALHGIPEPVKRGRPSKFRTEEERKTQRRIAKQNQHQRLLNNETNTNLWSRSECLIVLNSPRKFNYDHRLSAWKRLGELDGFLN